MGGAKETEEGKHPIKKEDAIDLATCRGPAISGRKLVVPGQGG